MAGSEATSSDGALAAALKKAGIVKEISQPTAEPKPELAGYEEVPDTDNELNTELTDDLVKGLPQDEEAVWEGTGRPVPIRKKRPTEETFNEERKKKTSSELHKREKPAAKPKEIDLGQGYETIPIPEKPEPGTQEAKNLTPPVLEKLAVKEKAAEPKKEVKLSGATGVAKPTEAKPTPPVKGEKPKINATERATQGYIDTVKQKGILSMTFKTKDTATQFAKRVTEGNKAFQYFLVAVPHEPDQRKVVIINTNGDISPLEKFMKADLNFVHSEKIIANGKTVGMTLVVKSDEDIKQVNYYNGEIADKTSPLHHRLTHIYRDYFYPKASAENQEMRDKFTLEIITQNEFDSKMAPLPPLTE